MVKSYFYLSRRIIFIGELNFYNFIESAPVFSIQSAVLDSFRDMVTGDIFLFFQVSYGTSNF
jgi:hypothetical protein